MTSFQDLKGKYAFKKQRYFQIHAAQRLLYGGDEVRTRRNFSNKIGTIVDASKQARPLGS